MVHTFSSCTSCADSVGVCSIEDIWEVWFAANSGGLPLSSDVSVDLRLGREVGCTIGVGQGWDERWAVPQGWGRDGTRGGLYHRGGAGVGREVGCTIGVGQGWGERWAVP